MFKFVACNEETFIRIRKFCKCDNPKDWSQTNYSLFGILLAYEQPNMIGEPGEADFFWCRAFLRWLF